jgi:uncharacterized protein YpmS
MTENDWKDLKTAGQTRKVELSDSLITAEKDFMQRQVRAELAAATFGTLERYKVLIEDDVQLNAALELFPRASKLMAGVFEPDHKIPAKKSTNDPAADAEKKADAEKQDAPRKK